jgi:hypothetical protein
MAGSQTEGGTSATFWRLRMGEAWTVPAIELTRGEPRGTTLLLTDSGRSAAGADAGRLLAAGQRVVAIDPFYFGESKIAQRDFLFALLVSAVGDRPLGIQARQVAATAKWLKSRETEPASQVTVIARGPRSTLFALVAGALDESIDRVELHDSYGSLKEILEQNRSVDQAPELFCFGLLHDFDIAQLTALTAPRPVGLANPGQRSRHELAGLKSWYALLGREHDPLK